MNRTLAIGLLLGFGLAALLLSVLSRRSSRLNEIEARPSISAPSLPSAPEARPNLAPEQVGSPVRRLNVGGLIMMQIDAGS